MDGIKVNVLTPKYVEQFVPGYDGLRGNIRTGFLNPPQIGDTLRKEGFSVGALEHFIICALVTRGEEQRGRIRIVSSIDVGNPPTTGLYTAFPSVWAPVGYHEESMSTPETAKSGTFLTKVLVGMTHLYIAYMQNLAQAKIGYALVDKYFEKRVCGLFRKKGCEVTRVLRRQ